MADLVLELLEQRCLAWEALHAGDALELADLLLRGALELRPRSSRSRSRSSSSASCVSSASSRARSRSSRRELARRAARARRPRPPAAPAGAARRGGAGAARGGAAGAAPARVPASTPARASPLQQRRAASHEAQRHHDRRNQISMTFLSRRAGEGPGPALCFSIWERQTGPCRGTSGRPSIQAAGGRRVRWRLRGVACGRAAGRSRPGVGVWSPSRLKLLVR